MRVFASYDAKEFNKKTVCYIYSGAKLLNKHPEEVRSCETFVSLKRQSKSSGI